MLFKTKNKFIKFGNFLIKKEHIVFVSKYADIKTEDFKLKIVLLNSHIEIPINNERDLDCAYELISEQLVD